MGRRSAGSFLLIVNLGLAACGGHATQPNGAAPGGHDSQSGGGGSSGGDGGDANSSVDYSHFSRIVSRLNGGSDATLCTDGQCPEGDRCFRITREFGICAPTTIAEATECNTLPTLFHDDECGCEGKQCSAGRICRSIRETCSCGGNRYNGCVELPCSTDADCGDDICVPSTWLWGSRCVEPSCRSDADCKEHPGMRCVAWLGDPSQAGERTFEGTACVYNERPDCADPVQIAPDAFICQG